MKNFSCVLSEFVKDRKVNISALSSETGIERTLLHKFISGTRTPSDIKIVLKLSEGLMLSCDEKENLCSSYRFTSLGEEGYENCRTAQRIFSTLSNFSRPDIFKECISAEKLIPSVIYDRLSVSLTIHRMISESSCKRILIISPPLYSNISGELTAACMSRPEISIIQILSFSPCDTGRNLRTLEKILPLLLFCDDYTPLINYSRTSETDSILPNIIITEKYAFCFSRECDRGILHTRSDILKFYRNSFDRTAEKTPELIFRKISDSPEFSDAALKLSNNLYIENDDKKMSLVFRTGSFWSSILIYEQSLRKSLKEAASLVFSL